MSYSKKTLNELMQLSRQLSDALSRYDDRLLPKLKPFGEDPVSDKVRKSIVVKASSLVNTPRFVLGSNLPKNFRPYWLNQQLFDEVEATFLRAVGNADENKQLDNLLELDEKLRLIRG